MTTEEYIRKAKSIHGEKFDYSKTQYVNCRTKLTIICPIHGEFSIRPDGHLKGYGCPKCGKQYSGVRKTLEQFIEDSIRVHGNFYDYSKVKYVNSYTKVEIVCPKHGSFLQTPNAHINLKEGCKQCALENRVSSLQDFIEKARKIHGDKYDYREVVYKNENTPVCIICPKHGKFLQTPHNHLGGSGCPVCKDSKGEREVFNYLTSHSIPFSREVICTCPKDVRTSGRVLIDFVGKYNGIPFAIEYNGEQHYKYTHFGKGGKFESQLKRDDWVREWAKSEGISLLEIKYDQDVGETLQKFFSSLNK